MKKRKLKQRKDLERQENVREKMKVALVIKNKVEDVDQNRLVFFEKNLNKVVKLGQKTFKEKK